MSSRYEIREQIGKGGLGAVYKAFDTQLQREVAIKRVLSPDQATDEEVQSAAENLIGEAQTLSSLNHPNIITVFDVGQDDQGGFVVMELLKGETLDETIERGVLTQEDFTEVVYQTMEALIAAQANNVIHRDIKPTNIMVIWQASGKFQTKILDFGLAKFSKTPSVQTMDQEESVLGSIFFMAPEQFERAELDARTDLYQMGCVYYNALTGQYPFNGETAPQVMNAHLQHKVIPLEQIRPDLSPSICLWVMWLINRDIHHRPEDARDALKRWPRNPEATDSIPAQKLPVEKTPNVSTGEIKIVTAASQAYAPPQLIVGATSPNSPAGATGPTSAIGRHHHHREPLSNKTKLIIAGSILGVILIFASVGISKSLGAKKQQDRINQLAMAEDAIGTADDVGTAVDVLSSRKSSTQLKANALIVLTKLEGSGVDERIAKELAKAQSSSLRINLSKALASRGYHDAFSQIIDYAPFATSDDQKVQFINAARQLATPDDLEAILGVLKQSSSLTVRKTVEDAALSILRQDSAPDKTISKLLTRVSTTSGDERKSLFRILGTMGTEAVKTRLSSIYNQKKDLEYQRDAMIAYLYWNDRSAIPDVEEIINNTQDKGLRAAAEKALARLVTLPSNESLGDMIATWDRAADTIQSPNDLRRIVGTLFEYPHPKTLALLRSWAKRSKLNAIAKSAIPTMEKFIAAVKTIKPGDELPGNHARIQGDKKASLNSSLGSITNWTSPDTWFSWSFRLAEAGNYKLEVNQATLSEKPSDIVVYLNAQTFEGRSEKTNSIDSFKPVELRGSVWLKPNMIYTLVLKAGEYVEPELLDIASIKLIKS